MAIFQCLLDRSGGRVGGRIPVGQPVTPGKGLAAPFVRTPPKPLRNDYEGAERGERPYGTWIRESELAALQLDDIDFAHDELTVREGKGKKERKIPLMPELKRALRRYVEDRERQANIIDEETLFLARSRVGLRHNSAPRTSYIRTSLGLAASSD
jgi:integrase